MTNYDRIKELSADEMAWFLMAYSDSCRTCVYKAVRKDGYFDGQTFNKCSRGTVEDTCIGGTEKWLEREEMTGDDRFMFSVCKNNVVIDRWNALPEAKKEGLKLKYENGMAVGIVDDESVDAEFPPIPLPF